MYKSFGLHQVCCLIRDMAPWHHIACAAVVLVLLASNVAQAARPWSIIMDSWHSMFSKPAAKATKRKAAFTSPTGLFIQVCVGAEGPHILNPSSLFNTSDHHVLDAIRMQAMWVWGLALFCAALFCAAIFMIVTLGWGLFRG